MAAITSVSNDLVLSTVPAHSAGSAASVSETAYEVGVVLGTTLIGGAVAAVYRLSLSLPAGVAENPLGAADTLGGAHAALQANAFEGAALVVRAADTAFRQGVMHTSAWVAVLVVLFALLVLRGLRGVKAS